MNLIIVYKVFIIYIVLLSERLVSAGNCCNSTSGSDSKKDPAYTATDSKTDVSKTSNKTGVDLKILDRRNTSDHTFQSNNNVDTFTPKGNKAFKKVKTNITDIWSTDKKDEYATKVEVTGTANDRVVTIHTGGKTKKFKKEGSSWKEQTGEQNSTDQTGTTPASGTTGTGGTNGTGKTSDPNGASGGGTGTGTQPSGGTPATN